MARRFPGLAARWARAGVRPALAAAVPLAGFLATLAVGVPASLILGSRIAVAGFGVALLLAFWRPGRGAAGLAAPRARGGFAAPLAALWQSGATNSATIGGLVPFSDANAYYYCARVLVEGQLFHSAPGGAWCSRRPLFSTAFAGLLAVTGQDLRQVLVLFVLLTAVACLLAAREVRASHGVAAGVVFLVTLALYYQRFSGTTLSEHLGLSLGAVGFAALWRGTRRASFPLFLVGMLALSVALNARAGAFLVLPAAAAWASRWFPGSAGFSWRRLALASGAVLLGFGLNAGLVRGIGIPSGMFSNYATVLYGLVFGGDWLLVFKQHPELASVAEPAQSREIMRLALDRIWTHPASLPAGAVRAWQAFFTTPYSFEYLAFPSLNLMLRIAAGVGLAACAARRREPLCSLVLAMTLGLILSIPFVPPWDADSMRAYAATVPALVAVPAVGIAWVASRLRPRATGSSPRDGTARSLALWMFAAGLVALAVVPALALALLREPPRFPGPASDCRDTMYVRAPAGSMVSVVRDGGPARYPVEVTESRFRGGLSGVRGLYPELADALAGFEAPFGIFGALRLQPFGQALVVVPAPLVPDPAAGAPFWHVCAEPDRGPAGRRYALTRAVSIRPAWRLPAR